jgi:cobalt-zinc-cadmium resistance protein CzcA
VLASFLLKKRAHHEPWLPRKLQAAYEPLLAFALRPPAHRGGHRRRLMLVWRPSSTPVGLGKTFMPTMDEGDIIVQLEKLPSISLAQTIALDLEDPAGADEGRARDQASSPAPAPTRSASTRWA